MTFKKGFILFLLSFSIPLFAAIKVGTEFFYPPYVISTSLGFDINLMQTLCLRMQQKCKFIPMHYQEIFSALDAGKIDIAISGIAISPSLLQKYLFSEPYLISKGQFLVLNHSEAKSLSDLYGNSVGIAKQEGFHQFLTQNYNNNFKIVEYRDIDELVAALNSGDVAAAFMHRPTANYWIQNGGKHFKALGTASIVGQGFGIIALHGDSALIHTINQQLESIENDNTYLALYKTYIEIE